MLMAAGGGMYTAENKILPGAYINFISKARAMGTLGERGTAALVFKGDWGKSGKIITVSSEDFQTKCMKIFGCDYTDIKMQNLRELFMYANEAKIYIPDGGEKARATKSGIKATAKCEGIAGNEIKIVIENDANNEGSFIVYTYFNTSLMDTQEGIKKASELKENEFVIFEEDGENALAENSGIILSGGANAEITGETYSKFLSLIEAEDFTTLMYDGEDEVIKGLFATFTKRLRDECGYKITCVLHTYNKADHEGIISVKNTVNADNKNALCYWVCGRTAGAEINESLTNEKYAGELDINATYTKTELKEAINEGSFIIYNDHNDLRVLKDINSFTSFTADKNSDFSFNQVVRVLDSIGNDIAKIFTQYYAGKVQNDSIGRDIFKSEIISYHKGLEAIRAIETFDENSVIVKKGTEKGDVVVSMYVEPVVAMDKLYMTCVVE